MANRARLQKDIWLRRVLRTSLYLIEGGFMEGWAAGNFPVEK